MIRIGNSAGIALLAAAIMVSMPAAAVEPSATVPPAVRDYAAGLGGEVFETRVFEGDFSGDGAPDAIAFTYYASGGNAAYLDISLFESAGGKLVHSRVVDDVFGGDPRDVDIASGRIEVTMTVLKPGEPRCCPTGTQRYTIKP